MDVEVKVVMTSAANQALATRKLNDLPAVLLKRKMPKLVLLIHPRRVFTRPKNWSPNVRYRIRGDELDERYGLPVDQTYEVVYKDGRVKVYLWKDYRLVEKETQQMEHLDAKPEAGMVEHKAAQRERKAAWASFKAQAERAEYEYEVRGKENVPDKWENDMTEDWRNC